MLKFPSPNTHHLALLDKDRMCCTFNINFECSKKSPCSLHSGTCDSLESRARTEGDPGVRVSNDVPVIVAVILKIRKEKRREKRRL